MDKNIHNLYCMNDVQAFIKYKNYNFVYNKFDLIKKQDITCNIVGVYPNEYTFPIIIKPIINLFGMSRDVKLCKNIDDYALFLKNTPHPSSFWMPYYDTNEHFTCDILMCAGKVVYSNSFRCVSTKQVGIFKKHIYINDYIIDKKLICFLENYIVNYTGCLNIEIIDNVVIEIHLRFNGDNYIYKENPQILDYLNSLLHEEILSIKEYDNIQTYKLGLKYYYYLPIFIENMDNYKDEKNKIDIFIHKAQTKNSNIKVYYDNIEGVHQQEKKRYCMLTVTM